VTLLGLFEAPRNHSVPQAAGAYPALNFGEGNFHEISFDDVIVLIQPWYNFVIQIKRLGTNSNKFLKKYKFHLYSLKVSANVKIAMQCFEIFGRGNDPNDLPWLCACPAVIRRPGNYAPLSPFVKPLAVE